MENERESKMDRDHKDKTWTESKVQTLKGKVDTNKTEQYPTLIPLKAG